MKPIDSLEKIHHEFKTPINAKEVHQKRLTMMERTALFITEKVGTLGFFLIIFSWTVIWLGWNILGPRELQFDPAPSFVFWLFISNLIQLHLMPLILLGQNIEGRYANLRAAQSYEIGRKAEKEIEVVIAQLAEQQKILQELQKKIEKL